MAKIGVNAKISIIGITGNISSGKSILLESLKNAGLSTLSVDKIINNLYKSDQELRNIVIKILGDDILKGPMLSKELIANKVFASKKLLSELEQATLPYVMNIINDKINTTKQSIAIEVPLLFELSLEKIFDLIIFIDSDKNECKKRSQHTHFDERYSRFLNAEYKKEKADIIITNNRTLDDFKQTMKDTLSREGILI